jgi:hypothetical protein
MLEADATPNGPSTEGAVQPLRQAEREADEEAGRGVAAMLECEAVVRKLAQLAFGVSAARAASDAIERMDRAGVAVFHPPKGLGRSVLLVEDGLSLLSTSRRELVIELAGVVCRLLIDRGARVTFRKRGGGAWRLDWTVDAQDTLVARTQSSAPRARPRLKTLGWTQGPKMTTGSFVQRWASPVTAILPAKLAVDTLFSVHGVRHPSELEVAVNTIAH